MEPDQPWETCIPFSLDQKLAVITENSPWYSDASASPWGRAIVPLEMVSVLAEYSSAAAGFRQGPGGRPVRRPGNPHDRGPLFVGEDYLIRREIVALAESRRTKSYWVRSRIYDPAGEARRPKCCSTTRP